MSGTIESSPHDGARVLVVILSAVVAVVGSVIGSGALVGTPISQVADGALAADATAVAPGGPAFSIWTLIYLGFLALAIWQALPAHRTDPRQRRAGWWLAAAMVLNAAWIACVQFEQLWLSVLTILALLAVLVVVFDILTNTKPSSRAEAIVVDATAFVYLGWVCVAVVANIAAALAAAEIDPFALGADTWAVLVLTAVALVAVRPCRRRSRTLHRHSSHRLGPRMDRRRADHRRRIHLTASRHRRAGGRRAGHRRHRDRPATPRTFRRGQRHETVIACSAVTLVERWTPPDTPINAPGTVAEWDRPGTVSSTRHGARTRSGDSNAIARAALPSQRRSISTPPPSCRPWPSRHRGRRHLRLHHRPPRHHRGPRPSGIAHLRPHHRTPQPTRRRRCCNDDINGDIRHHRTRASWSNGLSTRLKQWRAAATCYDKLALTYPAGFLLASIAEWLKPLGNMAQLDYRGCPMVRPAGPSQKCLQGRGATDSSGEQPQQQCHVGVHVKPPFGCGDGRTMFRRA